MAPPARDGRRNPPLQVGADVKKGRRAGAAVEIFVGAAVRHVGLGALEVDGRRPGGMRQIPDGDRARCMRLLGQCLHVVQPARPVVDLGQHQNGDVPVDRIRNRLRLDDLQAVSSAEQLDEAIGHVEIGREVAAVAEDDAAIGNELDRGPQQLEQIDRDGVAGDHAALRRADEPGDLVAHDAGKPEPARGVP